MKKKNEIGFLNKYKKDKKSIISNKKRKECFTNNQEEWKNKIRK